MELFQLLLIALFAYLGSIGTPWFFGTTGGFYTLGRPLIAAAIVGIILGDIPTALAVGVLIQAMYIGVITPGAVMSFDVNYIGYLATALVILSGADPKLGAHCRTCWITRCFDLEHHLGYQCLFCAPSR